MLHATCTMYGVPQVCVARCTTGWRRVRRAVPYCSTTYTPAVYVVILPGTARATQAYVACCTHPLPVLAATSTP
jgi:hypothetical protein